MTKKELVKQINYLNDDDEIVIHFIERIFNHEYMFNDINDIKYIEKKDGKIILNVYPNES